MIVCTQNNLQLSFQRSFLNFQDDDKVSPIVDCINPTKVPPRLAAKMANCEPDDTTEPLSAIMPFSIGLKAPRFMRCAPLSDAKESETKGKYPGRQKELDKKEIMMSKRK